MGKDTQHLGEGRHLAVTGRVMEMPLASSGASPRRAGSRGVGTRSWRQWEPSMALEQGTDVIRSWFQKEKMG